MLHHKQCELSGVTLHYVESGQASDDTSPLLVFLHGFPEFWHSWHHQLAYFGGRYRVIAPDLPGYNKSSKPSDPTFYQVPNLIAVMAEFVERVSGDQSVVLIAHDWGGAIAWPLAAFHPALFEKLIILNAAHPSTFTREMIHNPEQRRKSAYIHDLVGGQGVHWASANEFENLRKMAFDGRFRNRPDPQEQQKYIDAWGIPGVIDGMLAYYRQMPQLAPQDAGVEESGPVTAIEDMKIPNIRIHCPTLVLWGDRDEAFVPELLTGIEDYVPECTITRFPEASHWLLHECPDEVNQAIDGFISA